MTLARLPSASSRRYVGVSSCSNLEDANGMLYWKLASSRVLPHQHSCTRFPLSSSSVIRGTMAKLPAPVSRKKSVHRAPKSFPRFQADQWSRINPSWRRPHGIDNRARRRFKGNLNLPKIGYGTAKATRNQLPGGFLKFRIHNVAELELLLMHNRKYAAEVAGSVSVKTRRLIVERAAQLNVRVTNAGARLTKQEAQ